MASSPPFRVARDIIIGGSCDDFRRVIQEAPDIVLESDPATARTLLIMASRHGRADIVHLLLFELARRPNVNATDGRWTSLHFAAEYGHEEVAELLLRAGAMTNIQDTDEDTPLHIALAHASAAADAAAAGAHAAGAAGADAAADPAAPFINIGRMLVRAGADKTLQNESKMAAVDFPAWAAVEADPDAASVGELEPTRGVHTLPALRLRHPGLAEARESLDRATRDFGTAQSECAALLERIVASRREAIAVNGGEAERHLKSALMELRDFNAARQVEADGASAKFRASLRSNPTRLHARLISAHAKELQRLAGVMRKKYWEMTSRFMEERATLTKAVADDRRRLEAEKAALHAKTLEEKAAMKGDLDAARAKVQEARAKVQAREEELRRKQAEINRLKEVESAVESEKRLKEQLAAAQNINAQREALIRRLTAQLDYTETQLRHANTATTPELSSGESADPRLFFMRDCSMSWANMLEIINKQRGVSGCGELPALRQPNVPRADLRSLPAQVLADGFTRTCEHMYFAYLETKVPGTSESERLPLLAYPCANGDAFSVLGAHAHVATRVENCVAVVGRFTTESNGLVMLLDDVSCFISVPKWYVDPEASRGGEYVQRVEIMPREVSEDNVYSPSLEDLLSGVGKVDAELPNRVFEVRTLFDLLERVRSIAVSLMEREDIRDALDGGAGAGGAVADDDDDEPDDATKRAALFQDIALKLLPLGVRMPIAKQLISHVQEFHRRNWVHLGLNPHAVKLYAKGDGLFGVQLGELSYAREVKWIAGGGSRCPMRLPTEHDGATPYMSPERLQMLVDAQDTRRVANHTLILQHRAGLGGDGGGGGATAEITEADGVGGGAAAAAAAGGGGGGGGGAGAAAGDEPAAIGVAVQEAAAMVMDALTDSIVESRPDDAVVDERVAMSLQRMDIWSVAMIVRGLLNIETRFPFAQSVLAGAGAGRSTLPNLAPETVLSAVLSGEDDPSVGEPSVCLGLADAYAHEYEHARSVWNAVVKCTSRDPAMRPSNLSDMLDRVARPVI